MFRSRRSAAPRLAPLLLATSLLAATVASGESEEEPGPPLAVTGLVMNADGGPVAGARVVLSRLDTSCRQDGEAPATTAAALATTTAADGRFEVTATVPGIWQLLVTVKDGSRSRLVLHPLLHPAHVPPLVLGSEISPRRPAAREGRAWAEWPAEASLQAADPSPAAAAKDEILGVVVDTKSERPVADALVWWRDGRCAVRTDAGGRFAGQAAEGETVEVYAATDRHLDGHLEIAAGAPNVVSLAPARPYSVRVVDASEQPVPEAAAGYPSPLGHSDAQGVLFLPRLPIHQLVFWLTRDGFRQSLIRLPADGEGDAATTVTLWRSWQVAGRLVDPRGRPLGGLEVRAADGTSVTSDDEGRFGLEVAVSGRQGLEVWRHGRFAHQVDIELPAEGEGHHALGDLEVANGTFLTLLILDPEGDGVPGAELFASGLPLRPRRTDPDGKPLAEPDAVSDEAGRARLATTMEPGEREIEVFHDDYLPRLVAVTGEDRELTVTLEPSSTLTGVVTADGRPVADVRVEALARPSEPMSRSPRTGSRGFRTTDEAGRYRIPYLPPGPVEIMASDLLGGERGWAHRLLTLEPGENVADLDLPPAAWLSGTVRDGDGNPLAGASVERLFTGDPRNTPLDVLATTDANGRYADVRSNPGTARLAVSHDDHGRIERDVVLAPGGNVVDLRFTNDRFRLDGRVLDGTRSPLSEVAVTLRLVGMNLSLRRTAETGADGRFAVEDLVPGTWTIELLHPTHVGAGPSPRVEVAADATVGDLTMVRGCLVHGQLIAPPGEQEIVALHAIRDGVRARAEIDRDTGRFVVGPLTPGSWRLREARGRQGAETATADVLCPAGGGDLAARLVASGDSPRGADGDRQ